MMPENEYRRVNRRVGRIISSGEITGSTRLILFGVSDNTRQLIEMLRAYGFEPDSIIDNDKRKQHTIYYGVPVYSVAEKLKQQGADTAIFVYSFYYTEMNAQILDYGYEKKQIFNFISYWRGTEFFRLCTLAKGVSEYCKIKRKYRDSQIFICPYTGTGDIYLIGTYLREYVQKNGISDYVLVVVSKACRRVAEIFRIDKIESISIKNVGCILNANVFAPELFPLHILNDSFVYTNPVQWIRGHKGLNFTDMFRIGVFDLPEGSVPDIPKLDDTVEIKKFVDEHGITDKTILLSPYSNTLSELPKDFWVSLAVRLSEKGYDVLTNSCGDKEPPIEGTKAIFFPLTEAIQIVDHMKGFVGVRSGFCDIISASKSKKVILYDSSNFFFAGSAYEYFSLNKMKLCSDAVEICYNTDDRMENIIESVLDCF